VQYIGWTQVQIKENVEWELFISSDSSPCFLHSYDTAWASRCKRVGLYLLENQQRNGSRILPQYSDVSGICLSGICLLIWRLKLKRMGIKLYKIYNWNDFQYLAITELECNSKRVQTRSVINWMAIRTSWPTLSPPPTPTPDEAGTNLPTTRIDG